MGYRLRFDRAITTEKSEPWLLINFYVGNSCSVLTSIVLFALNIAAISLSNVLVAFILLVAASGITGVGQGPTGYIKSISSYFDKQRGIAIGIAVSGTGIGTALLPLYAQWLITNMGCTPTT